MKNISHITEQAIRKVLIVEDEFINQQILGNIIATHYQPLYASNGQEALAVLDKEKVSLILLDLNMPVMDGFEFMKKMREIPSISSTPVIVLTAERDAEIQSLHLGAQDFIVKPYDMPEIILARVERSILLKEESDMIAKTARDPLTHLFTQTYFFEYIDEYKQLNPESDMDAVAIDIKHFGLINEMFSRKVGDRILVLLGETLKKFTERYEGIVSRIDGDLFFLYISSQDEEHHLNNLKEVNSHLVLEEYPDLKVELKVGIYRHCNHADSAEKAFDYARRACTLLHNNYSESIKYYDDEMYKKEMYGELLIHDMDKALQEKQFKVYLQPKYNIRGAKPVLASAEALVRWIHPKYGFISPGVFIPLFENNGLIHKLDKYIWNEAAAKIKKWKEEYGRYIPISTNVSRIDILSPNFEQTMDDVINSNGLDYSDLYLEVTESAYSTETNEIMEVMHRLKEKGYVIEIDDFGTGYSSLHLITAMPFDTLKIDMSFIRNMNKSEKDAKVVEIIIGIARYLNAHTVAEGVETEDQYLALKKMGCDVIQGYYFDKAIPMDEFDEKYMK